MNDRSLVSEKLRSKSDIGFYLSSIIALLAIAKICFKDEVDMFILETMNRFGVFKDEISFFHENTIKMFNSEIEKEVNTFTNDTFYSLNTSLFEEINTLNNYQLRWSTYKPKYYFQLSDYPSSGLDIGTLWQKTSLDNSLRTGKQFTKHFLKDLRYKTLPKSSEITYDYELYDPIIGYGKQVVKDFLNNVELHFEFITEGDEFAYRVSGLPINPNKSGSISMITFLKQEYKNEGNILSLEEAASVSSNQTKKFKGTNAKIGEYYITVSHLKGEPYTTKVEKAYPQVTDSINNHLSLELKDTHSHKIFDVFGFLMKRVASFFLNLPEANIKNLDMSNLQQLLDVEKHLLFDEAVNDRLPDGNLHFLQSTYSTKQVFQYQVVLNGAKNLIHEKNIDLLFIEKKEATERKYDSKFSTEFLEDIKYASFLKTTFANLYSSLQFSEGNFTYKDTESDKSETIEKGPFSLLHLSPSRNFFPRGFYWDEGFHLVTLNQYAPELTLKIIYDWFSKMMDKDTGYIPRELFLGDENKDGVDERWITQYGDVGNPDVLVSTFSDILDAALKANDYKTLSLINDMLLKGNLYKWFKKRFEWLTNVQSIGLEKRDMCFKKSLLSKKIQSFISKNSLYQWKGQSNDHCFPSGLDDFPRGATHNNEIPDLYLPGCEIHVDLMSWVVLFNKNLLTMANFLQIESDISYYQQMSKYSFQNMELLNYNNDKKMYCDAAVKSGDNKIEHICHEGYVSLYPFMLKLIPINDIEKLKPILDMLGNSEGLLSNFGIRSLSTKDQFYKTDDDYWRGKIWINMNYMILKALSYYFSKSNVDNLPLHQQASEIYSTLRSNIVENMYSAWEENGLGIVFENYNDINGNGAGVHGFTGWSSLIVNIFFELPSHI
ncbi:hypothetical protein QEN19_001661 [Hanseniaspora menglaensis]